MIDVSYQGILVGFGKSSHTRIIGSCTDSDERMNVCAGVSRDIVRYRTVCKKMGARVDALRVKTYTCKMGARGFSDLGSPKSSATWILGLRLASEESFK